MTANNGTLITIYFPDGSRKDHEIGRGGCRDIKLNSDKNVARIVFDDGSLIHIAGIPFMIQTRAYIAYSTN